MLVLKWLVNAKQNAHTSFCNNALCLQAARGGHLEVVKLLVDNGADFNAKTAGGGGTVLWWAKQTHGEDHPVITFLEELGALDVGPEL